MHETAKPVPSVIGAPQTDPLMGLLVRGELDSDLQALREAEPESPLSALWIDVDKFKQINDVEGHEAGDEVLRKIGSALKAVIAEKGTGYRYGGDEVVILMRNHALEEAKATADRIRETVSTVTFGKVRDKVTLSVGVACFPSSVNSLDRLLKAADEAMYEAKNSGGNAVCVSSFSGGASKAPDRIIRADVASRVEAVGLWMRLLQCNGNYFEIVVQNDSDEDVKIEGVALRIGTLYLSRPTEPGSTDDWLVGARSAKKIFGRFSSDPTLTLARKLGGSIRTAMREIDIVAVSRILGRLKRLSHTIQVTISGNSILQLGPS